MERRRFAVLWMAPPVEIDVHAEAVAGIVEIIRSKDFEDWCRKLGLGSSDEDIFIGANIFRLAIAFARKDRMDRAAASRQRRPQ